MDNLTLSLRLSERKTCDRQTGFELERLALLHNRKSDGKISSLGGGQRRFDACTASSTRTDRGEGPQIIVPNEFEVVAGRWC